jgi:hypothetical protein
METNRLVHKTTRTKDDVDYVITIKLADDCHNGHQDFSITGDMYVHGKARIERNCIGGGAIGDKIAQAFPDLAIFHRLHLCDYTGAPLYAVENGMYHADKANGMSQETFCEYYRVTEKEYKKLSQCRETVEYYSVLVSCGIIDRWKAEADEAIALLEKLTGNTFVCNSTKKQLHVPTKEAVEAFEARKASGYYTASARKAREVAEVERGYQELRERIVQEYESGKKRIDDVRAIDTYLLDLFITLKISAKRCLNYIYYSHTCTLQLNFHARYDNNVFSTAEYKKIKAAIAKDRKEGKDGAYLIVKVTNGEDK